ncbi:MAG TPA: GspH/FimT family pseudopilin [Allosphingosinicella sp.]|nr:GspH/FimT family pseudopilin [Allosphingosinicella sp.]
MAEPRRRAEGFTLVELMVVIVIIGLAAAAVVLAMPEQGGSLRSEAVRFAARAKAARDTAILESRTVAVRIGPAGYAVARRARGEWRTDADYEWAEGTTPEIAGAGGGSLRFDPTGLAQPAAVVLRRGERRAVIEIGGDGGVRVE